VEGLGWLAVYLAVWTLATMAFRGKRGRLEVTPLAVIYRLGFRLEPASGRSSRLVSGLGYASVAAAYASMGFFYYLIVKLIWARYVVAAPEARGEGIVPLIPGLTVPWSVLPHILVALGVAALIHELAHAVQARAEGLRVKNAGVALFIFIPAAFVEIDEDELAKAPMRSRLKVYSAGITANLLLFLVFTAAIWGVPCHSLIGGVRVIGVEEGSPASLGGLEKGDLIVAVNGEPVHCIKELSQAFEEAGVKDPSRAVDLALTVKRGGETVVLRIHKPVNRTLIGVTVSDAYTTLGVILYSSWMLNIALALINAAPLFITDGGRLLTEPAEALLGASGRAIALGLQSATLIAVLSLISLKPILPG
jgi:membrane-associated protease RseP (regulator of RpoE activity)